MEEEVLPTSRQKAKSLGSPRYFTGRPCIKGHVSPRITSTGNCLECVRGWDRKRARTRTKKPKPKKRTPIRPKSLSPRQQALLNGDRYYIPTKPCRRGHLAPKLVSSFSCTECRKEDYKANKKKILEDRRKYYRENRDRIREKQNEYLAANGGARVRSRINYSQSLKQATPDWLDTSRLRQIWDLRPEGLAVDHEVPINHEIVCGLNVPWNLCFVAKRVNEVKKNYFNPDEWYWDPVTGRFERIISDRAPDHPSKFEEPVGG